MEPSSVLCAAGESTNGRITNPLVYSLPMPADLLQKLFDAHLNKLFAGVGLVILAASLFEFDAIPLRGEHVYLAVGVGCALCLVATGLVLWRMVGNKVVVQAIEQGAIFPPSARLQTFSKEVLHTPKNREQIVDTSFPDYDDLSPSQMLSLLKQDSAVRAVIQGYAKYEDGKFCDVKSTQNMTIVVEGP